MKTKGEDNIKKMKKKNIKKMMRYHQAFLGPRGQRSMAETTEKLWSKKADNRAGVVAQQ